MASSSIAAFACCALLSSAALAAEKHPDFSGVWTNYRAPGAPPPARPSAMRVPNLPFTAEGKQKAEEYRALVAENQDSPGAFCLGTGMPGAMLGSGGYPMEWIQRPEQVTVVYEAHTEIRRIYTDGRQVDPHDMVPSRDGYSTGHWEGDVLVVETTQLKEAIDQQLAHSEQAKIVERYSASKGPKGERLLTAEMTLIDPVFYAEPVKQTKTWAAAKPHTMMIAYDCNEPAWEDHLDELRRKAAAKKAAIGVK